MDHFSDDECVWQAHSVGCGQRRAEQVQVQVQQEQQEQEQEQEQEVQEQERGCVKEFLEALIS